MRLGGPVSGYSDPDSWIRAIQAKGYRAASCPVQADADGDVIGDYRRAAAEANIVIAEVGAWSNPLGPDGSDRAAAMDKCKAGLQLAEEIGARCCVNISGSRGTRWDGPDAANLTQETFDRIVATVREIIDAVKPTRTCYALEPMPWMYPDSPDSYVSLIEAIDRVGFGVHLDPVNMVNCPARYFGNAELLRACFDKLGPHIRSCHAKDIILRDNLTVHLDEGRPGSGAMDYGVYLEELSKLDPDTPLILEHLDSEEEYTQGAEFIRSVAAEVGCEV